VVPEWLLELFSILAFLQKKRQNIKFVAKYFKNVSRPQKEEVWNLETTESCLPMTLWSALLMRPFEAAE
jgi:hypothetical protein